MTVIEDNLNPFRHDEETLTNITTYEVADEEVGKELLAAEDTSLKAIEGFLNRKMSSI
jgi:hypothetical protein